MSTQTAMERLAQSESRIYAECKEEMIPLRNAGMLELQKRDQQVQYLQEKLNDLHISGRDRRKDSTKDKDKDIKVVLNLKHNQHSGNNERSVGGGVHPGLGTRLRRTPEQFDLSPEYRPLRCQGLWLRLASVRGVVAVPFPPPEPGLIAVRRRLESTPAPTPRLIPRPPTQ